MTLDELWARMEAHQPYADQHGYGKEWKTACKEPSQRMFQTLGDFLWAHKDEDGRKKLSPEWYAWANAAYAAWHASWLLRDISLVDVFLTKSGEGKE